MRFVEGGAVETDTQNLITRLFMSWVSVEFFFPSGDDSKTRVPKADNF